MRRLILILLLAGISRVSYPLQTIDYINDDYRETNTITLHSTGLLTYGLHSNTFHLRKFYFRLNYNAEVLQFYFTLNGFKDTHNPDSNYSFIIEDINLYDYGVNYLFFDRIYLSLRGAAVYRKNLESFLMMPAYYSPFNPGEFDAPDQYIPFVPIFQNAPGIRIAYINDHFEIGYSQGDFQHAIPIAGVLRYYRDNFYAKLTIQRVNSLPQTYVLTNFYWMAQISTMGKMTLGDWKFSLLGEYTWEQPGYGFNWLRFEQAVEYIPLSITLAVREMYRFDKPFLFEASVKMRFEEMASLGFFAASDGRMYVGSEIKF